MIDGGWLSVFFVLLAIGVSVFIFRQNRIIQNIEILPEDGKEEGLSVSERRVRHCIDDICDYIEKGTQEFVARESRVMIPFVLVFSLLVFMLTGCRGRKEILPSPTDPPGNPIIEFVSDYTFGAFSAVAYCCGAATSAFAGYIGIYAATAVNGRVAHKICDRRDRTDTRRGVEKGFETCLRGGAVMSFGMITVGVCNIFVLMCLYLLKYDTCTNPLDCDQKAVAYCLLSYALGASSISILHRIGGSIYMKSVDLCRLMLAADPIDAIDLPDFDARNPATIADCVGDVVGDVAGASADFFGNFAQSICACLAIMASAINTLEMDRTTPLISHWSIMCLPLMIYMVGIVVSMVVYLLTVSKASPFRPDITVKPKDNPRPTDPHEHPDAHPQLEKDYIKTNLQQALWHQVVTASLITAIFEFLLIMIMLPDSFYVDYWLHEGTRDKSMLEVKDWQLGLCALIGSVTGLIGGYVGMYYTSEGSPNAIMERGNPVRAVFDAAGGFSKANSNNAALVIIKGVSLGYESTIATCVNLAVGIYASHSLGFGLGTSFAAIGAMGSVCSMMITTTFGPIAKNAHAVAVMAGMDEESKHAAEQLATAGNNVLAMSKGFSTTVAALVAYSLVSAFVLRADVQRANLSIFEPLCVAGLLIGCMLPYYLSAMVIHAVGKTAGVLKQNIQAQFHGNGGETIMSGQRPNYDSCIQDATDASLTFLVPIGLMVVLVPLSFGLFFGRAAVAGLAIGCILTGVPHSVSLANTGGIWSMTRQLMQANYMGPTEAYDKFKAKLVMKENEVAVPGEETEETKEDIERELEEHKPKPAYEAAQVGEDVADPIKDAVAPAVSVLMKEVAMLACVLGPYFASVRGGYGTIGCDIVRNCNPEEYPMEGFDYVLMFLLFAICGLFGCLWVARCFTSPSQQGNPAIRKDTNDPSQPLLQGQTTKYEYTPGSDDIDSNFNGLGPDDSAMYPQGSVIDNLEEDDS